MENMLILRLSSVCMEFLNSEGSDSVTKFITYTYANIKQNGLTFFQKGIQSFCNAPNFSQFIS